MAAVHRAGWVRRSRVGTGRFRTEGTERQSHGGPPRQEKGVSREAHSTFSVALCEFLLGALCEEPWLCHPHRTVAGPFTRLLCWRDCVPSPAERGRVRVRDFPGPMPSPRPSSAVRRTEVGPEFCPSCRRFARLLGTWWAGFMVPLKWRPAISSLRQAQEAAKLGATETVKIARAHRLTGIRLGQPNR